MPGWTAVRRKDCVLRQGGRESMRSVRSLMLGLVLSLWLGTSWSHSLTITVENISEAGELHIAIYDSKEAFEQDRGEKGGPATGIVDGLIHATRRLGSSCMFLTFQQANTPLVCSMM